MDDDNYDPQCAVTAAINALVMDLKQRGFDEIYIAEALESVAAKINENIADGLLHAFGHSA